MDLQKRRTFIISFIYFAIIGVICYILFKRLIPMLMPFIMALAIAAALDPAVSFLGSRICFMAVSSVWRLSPGTGCFPASRNRAGSFQRYTAKWWNQGFPGFSRFWKPVSQAIASISPPLGPVWSMPWKMQQAPFPPA